ncbi:MAG: DUF1320 domain-containing protein [Culturomica sp.]|jgi:phage gp36-like protein|nr:DUF1320 domain-containing protein [Culturomica sp.]
MEYITTEEFYGFMVKDQVARLTDKLDGEPNMAVLEKINTDAVSEINGYLRGLYQLPLPEPVDPILKTIAGDLMRFRLLTRRDVQNQKDSSVFELYKMVLARLRDIQQKKVILDAPGAGGDSAPVTSGTVQSWTPTQKFGNHFTGFDQ